MTSYYEKIKSGLIIPEGKLARVGPEMRDEL
jgi:hypothetical protein